MYFSTADTDYWYEIHGEGTPIVLLHGFTGSSATWNALVSSAPDGFQFILIDLPGHGQTKGEEITTIDACCEDIFQLLHVLQIDTFHLAGYSLGGRTALTYALKYPAHVKGLILESASPGLADANERRKRKGNDNQLAEKILSEGVDVFVDYWENIPLFSTQKSLSEEVQEQIRKERLAQRARGLAHSLYGMGTGAQASHWGKLTEISFPVLLLVGELDTKFMQINKKMAEEISNVQLEIVKDTGHAIHIEKPQAFNEHVIAFANSHSS